MSNTPNAGHIVIPDDKAQELYRVITEVKTQLDNNKQERAEIHQKLDAAMAANDPEATAQLRALKEQLDKTDAQLKATEARCDVLDANLKRGQKLYTEEAIPGLVGGVTRAQARSLTKVGTYMHDMWSVTNGRTPKYDHLQTRDQLVSNDGKGGYGVSRPIEEEVQALTPAFGFADNFCNVFTMEEGSLDINTATGFPTVEHPGEKIAPSDSTTTFSRLRMTPEKFITTCLMSREFMQDAMPSMMQFIARRHIQAQALERDRQVLTASADPFTGVFVADGVGEKVLGTGSVSFRHIDHDAIMDTIDAADESLFMDNGSDYANLRFAFHPQVLHIVRKIKDTTGQPLLAALAVGHPLTIFGYEYSRSVKGNKQITTGAGSAGKIVLAFGDWNNVWIGDRLGMEVAYSEHVKFGEAQVMMRVLRRYAVAIPLPASFARLKLAAS